MADLTTAYVSANGRALTDLVYQVLMLDGQLAPLPPVPSAVATADAPALTGAVFSVAARTFRVTVEVRPALLADRATTIRTLRERLRGVVELATLDAPSQVFYGVLAGVDVELYTGIYANPIAALVFTFRCDDPALYDEQPLPYALSATPVAIPIGTAAVGPIIELHGATTPVVNPSVIVRNHRGEVLSTLALTCSLGVTAHLRIDSARQRIDHYLAGVKQTGAAAGINYLTSGAFPVLDPADAAPEASAWATLALAATSGTPTGVALVQRAYN